MDEDGYRYFDDDDDDSDYEGSFEQYEDWYAESGYDPYHFFDDEEKRITALLRMVRYWAGRITRLIFRLRFGTNAVDDIPF